LFKTLPAATKSRHPFSWLPLLLTTSPDRDEALKDDYPLEGSTYDDEDEDDEWAGDDTTWPDEDGADDETDGKDESSAYLEFLNEEVSFETPASLTCLKQIIGPEIPEPRRSR
jgi:hypothetical protein